MKIGIVTDTISDLSIDFCNEHNITLIPSYVASGSLGLIKDTDVNISSFLSNIWNETPSTRSPRPKDFQALYKTMLENHDFIYSIHASINTSSIYLKATEAAKDFSGRIKVFDSGSISAGLGSFVSTFAKSKCELDLHDLRLKTNLWLITNSDSHTKTSNNINRNSIKIPINTFVNMCNGEINAGQRFTNMEYAVSFMKEQLIDKENILISHSLFPANVFDRRFRHPKHLWNTIPDELAQSSNVTINEMNPVLISHFGMSTLAIGFVST